ncbi:tetraacyldisaccharide 4'-kinase [Thermomonas carbonis]|uniref:Tetraacyldisaccharide 4'-kinase n=1 Tax=Thermomonas carbonis TaxID=1463158 RepID=A0A7G9SN11_9GAMM|nr:tetraacyldisaccharide 4'-kinase [Thermomonas carbonis]QNN69236.1 tetraacyldisaccharide 4'-kinase [Thermomonas carbonis]GHC05826.1 tetraacyldisaccharide 4'-kinase [Thermomonas carbonis]
MSRKPLPQTPAWWHDGSTPPLHARLLATLYGNLAALRRTAYRRDWLRKHKAGVPVLVVGNIVAGGTGKTPLVIALVARLRAEGWTPGVASRGHGREDEATPRWVGAGSNASQVGDEPLLIARATGVKVRVDRDRVAAAKALAAAGCDIVVCDDGLQHYRLARDIEIEVQDARRRYGNGRLLPAGPLREPVERAADCDFRVLNLGVASEHEVQRDSGLGEWPMRLRVGVAQPLHGGRAQPLSAFAGQRVHAVAGIGDPERFFAMLRDAGIAVVPHAFPDHHAYVAGDFEFGSRLPVLMTVKDAVKCADLADAPAFMVPVDAVLPQAFWVGLLERLPPRVV